MREFAERRARTAIPIQTELHTDLAHHLPVRMFGIPHRFTRHKRDHVERASSRSALNRRVMFGLAGAGVGHSWARIAITALCIKLVLLGAGAPGASDQRLNSSRFTAAHELAAEGLQVGMQVFNTTAGHVFLLSK
ncbi:hypothetical protein VI26_16045 [Chromobacterium sp. LK1]|nr:hypothetical protein VI26_16045 [Chromobacterium sp. LK1]